MSAELPLDSRDLLHDLQAGEVQCTARSKRTGEQCKRPSMLGGNVCRSHGGAAPQTRAKAQRRLQQAADVLVQRLLSFALDGQVADPVALQAIRDALDRAGMNPKTAVEVSLAPYEQVLAGLADVAHIPRAESRQRRGVPEPQLPEPLELPAADDNAVIDAEVVDTPPWAEDAPQPRSGLVSLERAAEEQAAEQPRSRRA